MSSTIGSIRTAFDRSFQLKLFILCGFFILLAGCVVTIYAISVVQNEAIESRGSSASDYAAGIANRIMDELDSSLEISRTVAKTFEGVKSHNIPLSRNDAINMLIPVFSSSPYLYGGAIVWEPNAFDDRDVIYERSMFHDGTGRFIPYLYKDPNGDIYVQPATGYGTDAWYLGPQATGSSVITEPFFVNISNKRELMTTISSPIIVDGTFLGVAMVDVKLERLQEHADAVKKRSGEGEMLIISNTGLIAAATGKPELRNQPMEKFHSFLSNDIINIGYGTSGYRVRNGYIEVYAPIYVSWTKTPWLVEVFYPTDGIMKEVRPVVVRLGVMGLVATILGVMCIWYGVRRLTLPLQMTSIGLTELTLGHTRRIEPKGNDEVADIARSFNRLVDRIEENNYQRGSRQNVQDSTKEWGKIQEIQMVLEEVKTHVSGIKQTVLTLSTSVQSSESSNLPRAYSNDNADWRDNRETPEQREYNPRIKYAADEIATDVYELQRVLSIMKEECESENLPPHMKQNVEDLEEHLITIQHTIKKLLIEDITKK